MFGTIPYLVRAFSVDRETAFRSLLPESDSEALNRLYGGTTSAGP